MAGKQAPAASSRRFWRGFHVWRKGILSGSLLRVAHCRRAPGLLTTRAQVRVSFGEPDERKRTPEVALVNRET